MRIHSTPHVYFLSQLSLSIFSLYHLLSQSILCFSTLVLVKIDLVGIPPHIGDPDGSDDSLLRVTTTLD